MKFMTMVLSSEARERELGPPPQALIDAVGKLGEEATKAGIAVYMGGLRGTAAGAMIRLSAGEVLVTDGPFAEAKEVVGGYSMFEVASKEEAVAWAVRLMEIHRVYWPVWEGACEVREVWGDAPE